MQVAEKKKEFNFLVRWGWDGFSSFMNLRCLCDAFCVSFVTRRRRNASRSSCYAFDTWPERTLARNGREMHREANASRCYAARIKTNALRDAVICERIVDHVQHDDPRITTARDIHPVFRIISKSTQSWLQVGIFVKRFDLARTVCMLWWASFAPKLHGAALYDNSNLMES